MNIDQVLSQYDALEETHDFDRIEHFLLNSLEEARSEGDDSSELTLLNEIIGFYRELGRAQDSVNFCREILLKMDAMQINGTMPYATSLLNIANACRAAGLLKESLIYYNEVIKIYDQNLSPTDFAYAPLYNNLALLFQEMQDFESAVGTLKKALGIAKSSGDIIKVAISHTNLGMSLLKTDELDEAIYNLEEADRIFTSLPETDYHYGAVLSAMGEAKYRQGLYEESAEYYEKALREVEKNTGRSQAYEITLSNLKEASAKAYEAGFDNSESVPESMNGLELSEQFYEEFGKPMIKEKFPEYADRIAVGLVGEGSECLGFDDEFSKDHDYGPGFIMWLTDEDYEKIGTALNDEYRKLPIGYKGTVRIESPEGRGRMGAHSISSWYSRILGYKDIHFDAFFLVVDEANLNKATNGKVFTDPRGEFSKIRNELKAYYPDKIWLSRIASEMTLVSQMGQYNYERALKRNDISGAMICLTGFMEHAMKLTYLLCREYAPYYKWLNTGLKKTDIFVHEELKKISGHMNDSAENLKIIESLCGYFVKLLKKQGLTSLDDTYLAHQATFVINSPGTADSGAGVYGSESVSSVAAPAHDELVDTIVKLEWSAFDKVSNEGGRASCQDDWETFSIMRKSQYLCWTDEMLESFINDFNVANEKGWNLITEKYGRMEESTSPESFEQIKDSLPPISEGQKQIIESIVEIQVSMMEEFALEYPKAAGNARSIHTYEDTPYNTSYETYLRGELSTYSETTLLLYGRFVAGLAAEGKNLAKMIIENTAHLYGYESLDSMEAKLQ